MTITPKAVAASLGKVDAPAAHASVAASEGAASRRVYLRGAFAVLLAYAGVLAAATTPVLPPPPKPVARPLLLPPSSAVMFQQTVQQQQVRDQLQKAQAESQNRQAVLNNSRLPHASNAPMQNQIDQADAAQQNIERARQQDIINRYEATSLPSGRIIAPKNAPKRPAGGG